MTGGETVPLGKSVFPRNCGQHVRQSDWTLLTALCLNHVRLHITLNNS